MKRNLPLDLDANLDLIDDFGDFTTTETEKNQKEKVTPIHSDNWTIIKAFNTINELLPGCQLKNDFFIRCAEAFDFLSNKGPDKIVRELKKLDDSTDGIGNLLEEENEETEVL